MIASLKLFYLLTYQQLYVLVVDIGAVDDCKHEVRITTIGGHWAVFF
jgi:hypothetical protein